VTGVQTCALPILELKPIEMETAVKEVLSTIHVPNNVQVKVNFSMPAHTHMLDPTIIRRIFTNLITNALQAMPKGGDLRIDGSGGDVENHIVEFRDTGVGIPEENLGKLFDPFFTTKAKGQGLGLAVCKRLIEAQGGTITVKSKLGEGSTFSVILPVNMS
jgi:signal transduction histidine kinase